ncbi:MAG: DUF2851 family protein [Candidatus Kapabacteria bacterium]|nr:DUF2851 family protein [Candidatus Kapabacteria bacterium]MDW8225525.1 DUF2851 family protein [Bacteroidota bacterium]
MHDIAERKLQEAVWHLLSDPARVWQTVSGKRLQILAPGELNVHEGPDFQDMVLLIDGTLYVGDGEFHRSAQEWQAHGHARDPRYSRVVLHIVTTPVTTPPPRTPEVLVVPEPEIAEALKHAESVLPSEITLSLYELQYFALFRLLRHTADSRAYAQQWGFTEGFYRLLSDFLQRYLQKRRRPVHSPGSLGEFLRAVSSSPIAQLLHSFYAGITPNMALQLQEIARQRVAGEGIHLRLEVLLNCVVPYLLAHAGTEQRIELLSWYWSAPARARYGHLRRRFPTLPQRYMWQQQGMLEFLRQRGSGLLCRELLASYRFGDVLEFYRTAEAVLGY